MKKFYFLSLFLVLTASLQAVTVTLRVDMVGVTVAAGGVFAAGNFQVAAGGAADWTPGVVQLTRQGTTTVYSKVVTLPAGSYEFKFLNGTNGVGMWQDPGGAQLSEQGVTAACGANGNRTITVPNSATYFVPMYKYDTCNLSPLSNDETALNVSVSVSPNPMSNYTLVAIGGNASYTVTMSNVLGQTVRTFLEVTEGEVRIAREGLNSGIYFLNIRNREGKFTTQKLVVE